MKNKIIIDEILLQKQRVTFNYQIIGAWKEAFNFRETFYIEYSCDISRVPQSILVVPLLANLLPIAWIYGAEIIVSSCDEDFYNSIPDFKKGYEEMYPMLDFGGKLTVKKLQKNFVKNKGSAAFFSGGVDAFNTLVVHAREKPILLTIWGADVQFEDIFGWQRILNHLYKTAEDFGIDFVTIKSSFRRFLNEGILSKKVAVSGDNWWHGFQHGIGIICHAAPVMYTMEKEIVYFASSFTAADKGKVTCASDPTIDNYVRFCGSTVCHDGYEFTRQMKIHNIVHFSEKTKRNIQLRVCWQSSGGSNCCNCEKCWRTILGIYAEGFDPKKFGFYFDDKQLHRLSNKMRYSGDKMFSALRYQAIQEAMQKNIAEENLPKEIKWFYRVDIDVLGEIPFLLKLIRKARQIIKNIIKI